MCSLLQSLFRRKPRMYEFARMTPVPSFEFSPLRKVGDLEYEIELIREALSKAREKKFERWVITDTSRVDDFGPFTEWELKHLEVLLKINVSRVEYVWQLATRLHAQKRD